MFNQNSDQNNLSSLTITTRVMLVSSERNMMTIVLVKYT